eukprot:scaffold2492_cov50-Cyclotella_meneghiniana.AAC.6
MALPGKIRIIANSHHRLALAHKVVSNMKLPDNRSDTPGQCLLPQLSMVEVEVKVKVKVKGTTSPSKTAANGSFFVHPGVNDEKPTNSNSLPYSLYLSPPHSTLLFTSLTQTLPLSPSQRISDFFLACLFAAPAAVSPPAVISVVEVEV